MTLADQAAMTGHDGQVTSGKPARPARRTFTAAYKARILTAYDALPEETKRRIASLRVVFRPAFDASRPAVDHPLVRTHPQTGRKALYLGNHATHILGMSEADSAALLGELLEHAAQRQFVYVHRWRVGDLVMWDNRCLLHRVVVDAAMAQYRRVMHRSVVRGTVPF